ncbi:FecR domain-containing protein [Pseudomonas cichorii]|uniref:FecR domain-containing protein n=1 Tax=Pseudomonas cichorii TaxID=36746 RepID=UPI000F00B7C0|nr:FecR family protein [Pseudomonas cichorii]
MSSRQRQPSAQVVRQAIEWSMRMNNPSADSAVRRQCEQWRSEHADHECAWQRIQTLSSELHSSFQALPGSGAAFEALEKSAQRLGRRQALKLLSGVAVLGSAAWIARDVTPWQQWQADFATNIGQHNSYSLPDGSRLQLNTDSAVDQDFNARHRLISLTRGEIMLACGADSASAVPRPLLVQSRHALFEGISGRFVVRQDQERTRVSVMQGSLIIRSPATSPISVTAGQSYVVSGHQASLLPALDMEAGAWTEGLIVTRNMRLGDFLAEVGRYRRGYLGCTDEIADLRLSGVFRLEDTDRLLAVLPQTLPVQLSYRTRWWVTLQRQA